MKTFRETVYDNIPEAMKLQLARVPFQALQIMDIVKQSHILFSLDVAKDLAPYLRRIAVDYCLFILAQRDPSYSAKIELNKKKNSRHVELTFGNNILTASFVKDRNELPRDAIFRNELIEQNPLLPYQEIETTKETTDQQYMILTYGGEYSTSIDFVNLKFPLKEGGHITYDLMPFVKLNHDDGIAPTENTDQDIAIELKNFIVQNKLVQ
ncbi:hypothetical protein LEP1GSC161_2758 [Leptospira santarosai str. CBC1416]|uniref:Uncharacterized protein n=1 Tax=Leptospira santarosai str. CBC1416 TaxID=1193059 RepID=M6VUW8_9LEPT|nr:hypothetical protein LEP1GSC161_2758 [Leptospira santarosai str. CBC1416]